MPIAFCLATANEPQREFTHDQEEALGMSDRIAIYSADRIDQRGTR